MTRFLGKFSEPIYALLRIVAGYMFTLHGAQKLFGVLGGQQQEIASLMGLAGIIEFFGGLLILVGLFASWAAFLASGQMAVAYFMAHVPQGSFLNPLGNDGEKAVLYCFLFLFIAAKGAGKWSVASALNKPSLQ
ncbi:MAG: DoxX family protein [Thermoanaerobaculia bacterium]